MWHLSHNRNMGVDPDASEIKGLSHPHRPAMIFSPDTRSQSIFNSIGKAQRFVIITKFLHCNYRPKISLWIISSSCLRPATTVGGKKKPGCFNGAPPVMIFAWLGVRSKIRQPVLIAPRYLLGQLIHLHVAYQF